MENTTLSRYKFYVISIGEFFIKKNLDGSLELDKVPFLFANHTLASDLAEKTGGKLIKMVPIFDEN